MSEAKSLAPPNDLFEVAGGLAGATILVDILMRALALLLFTNVSIDFLSKVVADP
jgi:hypothetical protein